MLSVCRRLRRGARRPQDFASQRAVIAVVCFPKVPTVKNKRLLEMAVKNPASFCMCNGSRRRSANPGGGQSPKVESGPSSLRCSKQLRIGACKSIRRPRSAVVPSCTPLRSPCLTSNSGRTWKQPEAPRRIATGDILNAGGLEPPPLSSTTCWMPRCTGVTNAQRTPARGTSVAMPNGLSRRNEEPG